MENPTKAITATLRTIIAIAATSTMESRLRSNPRKGPRKDASAGLGDGMLIGFYRRAELFRDRRCFLSDVPALPLGVFLGQLLLDLKHLFDERVRFPVVLGQLGGGVRSADVVGNRFLHTGADVAHVVLDHGGDARLGVLAAGCDEVPAEGDPLTSIAG